VLDNIVDAAAGLGVTWPIGRYDDLVAKLFRLSSS
jgi:hypothetical protein